VGSNTSVTLTDSIYGKITVGKNSTVTFTRSRIFLKELNTSEKVTIKFTESCVEMRVCEDVDLKDENKFNMEEKSVVVYTEKGFDIDKASTINASIYTLGDINVNAAKNYMTNMEGLYIADNVKSIWTNWSWNTNCGTCTNFNKKQVEYVKDEAGLIDPEVISLNVYPNPNTGAFGIDIITSENGTLNVSVTDLLGRTIYTESRPLDGPVYLPINLTGAANGQYIVQATVNGKVFTKKVMINK